MELRCTVVDKDGRILTPEELSKKVIHKQAYYDLVLPIRKRYNEQLQDKQITNFNG